MLRRCFCPGIFSVMVLDMPSGEVCYKVEGRLAEGEGQVEREWNAFAFADVLNEH